MSITAQTFCNIVLIRLAGLRNDLLILRANPGVAETVQFHFDLLCVGGEKTGGKMRARVRGWVRNIACATFFTPFTMLRDSKTCTSSCGREQ